MSTTEPTTSLAARVAAMEAGLAGQLPADAIAVLSADRQRMAAEGVSPDAARPGTVMPDSVLLDAHGAATSLRELRAGRAAVVVFYRGQWCPYCNLTLRTYQNDLVPALAQCGVPLIAISPQTPDGSLTTAEVNALTFAVVTDPGNSIAGRLGIVTAPSQDVRDTTLALGLDLGKASADGGYAVPMPTVVVLDSDGVIRWIDIHPDYRTRTEVPDILDAVRHLD